MENMIHPVTVLLVIIAAIAMIAIFFYPEKGVLARLKRARKNSERVLIEDALKHIYDCEYTDTHCTINSIAGNLSISRDRVTKLVEKLLSLGLIDSHTGLIKLTGEGRSYALRIIRIHRLWERYLADETGVPEKHWHTEAEIKEHDLSPDEAEALSAQLGHPLIDPHGDPIPSSSGTMIRQKGKPLSEFKEGEYAHIVHIEDEPEAIYAQIVAQGLHVGMQVSVIEKTEQSITIEADGNECVLTPLFATQIHVKPIQHPKEIRRDFTSLSTLQEGEEAQIVAISNKIRGPQRRRLMDLGIVPGTKVKTIMKSFGNDPIAYQVRGALIALRKNQTNGIFIKRIERNGNGK